MKNSKCAFFASGLVACALLLPTFVAEASTVAYWKFGESGFADSSGNGNSLLLSAPGGVSIGADGQAVFDGAQQTLQSANAFAFPNGYTIELFVRMVRPQQGLGMVVELGPDITGRNGSAYIDYNEESQPCGLGSSYFCNSYLTYRGDNYLLADGQWHHAALVVDPNKAGSFGVSALYVDGVLQPVGATKNTNLFSWPAGQALKLNVGQREGGRFPFVGEMDDIRVSNVPLTPSEFLKCRTANGTAKRVVAQWTFGAAGFKDVSGNGNDLVATDVTLGADGQAVFNGTSSYAVSSLGLDYGDFTTGYTMEFFARVPADAADKVQMLAEISENIGSNLGCSYVDYHEAAHAFLGCYRPNGWNQWRTAGSVNDGQWHHVAFVIDAGKAGTTAVASLYLDGVLQVLNNTPGPSGSQFAMPDRLKFYLGNRLGNDFWFRGEIDNVRITAGPLEPSAFLVARETAVTAELAGGAVFDMSGADATINVPAGEYLTYDRIVTGCDNANVVLTKTGAGILNVKSPFAGVWNLEGGQVVLPKGCSAPSVKAVAGRLLTVSAQSMTAGTTTDGSFTVAATVAGALKPRIATTTEALPLVKVVGVAELTLSDDTAHGETGLEAATESAVVDLNPQGADLLGDGGFEDPAVNNYVVQAAALKGWLPVSGSGGGAAFQFRTDGDLHKRSTCGLMPEGVQGYGLQGGEASGYAVTHDFEAPVAGIYELRFAAAARCYRKDAKDNVGLSVAVDGEVFHSARVAEDHRGSQYAFKHYAVDLPPLTAGSHTLALSVDGTDQWPIVLIDDVTLHLAEAGEFVPIANPGFENLGVLGAIGDMGGNTGWWNSQVAPVGWSCSGANGGYGTTQHSTWSSAITARTGDELREYRKMYLQLDASARQTVMFPRTGRVRLSLRYAARAMSNWQTGAGRLYGAGHELVVKIAGSQVGTAWPYEPALNDLVCEFDVEAGAQELELAVDPHGLTDCAAIVDDVRIRYIDGDEAFPAGGWSVKGETVRTTDGVARMRYGACMKTTVTVPADGFYCLRFDGTASEKAVSGGYELRIDGEVASSGRIEPAQHVVKIVSVGFRKKDALLTVALKNTVRGGGTLSGVNDAGLVINALTLEAPKMVPLASDFSNTLMELDTGAGLVLDYAGELNLAKLRVGGMRKHGSLTAATDPEFLRSAGTLNVGVGMFIIVR